MGSPSRPLGVLSDVLWALGQPSATCSQAVDMHPTTRLQSGVEQRQRVGHRLVAGAGTPGKQWSSLSCHTRAARSLGPSRCSVRKAASLGNSGWFIPSRVPRMLALLRAPYPKGLSASCTPSPGTVHAEQRSPAACQNWVLRGRQTPVPQSWS